MSYLQDATEQVQELIDRIEMAPCYFPEWTPLQKEFMEELRKRALVLQSTLALVGGEE